MRKVCLFMTLLVVLSGLNVSKAQTFTVYEEPVVEVEEGVMPLSTGSISDQYGVGTQNTAIMQGIVSKLSYGQHYVYWRQGQYEYRIAYGEGLALSGSTFTADSVKLITYTTNTGYNNQAMLTSLDDSNFRLNAGNYLVWSDLGDYPQLETGKGVRDYAHAAAFGVAVLMLYSLFRAFVRGIWGRVG